MAQVHHSSNPDLRPHAGMMSTGAVSSVNYRVSSNPGDEFPARELTVHKSEPAYRCQRQSIFFSRRVSLKAAVQNAAEMLSRH
jgi:hypothetical protein